jgi:adenylate cyclase class 2
MTNDYHENDYIESEVKLYVPDLAQVEAQLLKIGAICTKPRILERNVRYDLPDGSLTQEKRILRIRQDTQLRLTYKQPLADEDQPDQEGKISSRVEIETVIHDLDAMDSILRHLGYHPYMIYEKYRTTYELDGGEIVLDEMPYGNFVEIESTTDHIKELIIKANLSQALKIDAGYVALFRMLKKKLGLTFNDLTFSNFKNVYVPTSLFLDF